MNAKRQPKPAPLPHVTKQLHDSMPPGPVKWELPRRQGRSAARWDVDGRSPGTSAGAKRNTVHLSKDSDAGTTTARGR
jgi:hypothetical protein